MHLCSHNLRIGVLGDGILVGAGPGNTLVGTIGELYTKFFFSKNKSGNCSIQISRVTGVAAIKDAPQYQMLKNHSLDLILTKSNLGFGDQIIETTKLVGATMGHVAQFLCPHSRSQDVSSFLVQNVPLLSYILLGYLLIAITTAILPKLTHVNRSSRLKSLKLVLLKAPFMDHSQLPRVHMRLIFVSFSLFLFLGLNLISNTIKTEKVVVPTDSIVDSPAKLLATTKTLTLIRGGSALLKKAPKDSFFGKLSTKQIAEFSMNELGEMRKNLDRYVILNNDAGLVYWISLLSQDAKAMGLVAFLKSTVYYENLMSYQMRRSMDKERKHFINKVLDQSFEAGFVPTLTSNMRDVLILAIKHAVPVFEGLDEYVRGVSENASPNIKLQNVYQGFLYFFGFFVLVSLVAIVEVFLLKQLRTIYHKLFVKSSFLARQLSLGDFLFPIIKPKPENLSSVTFEDNASN